METKNGQSAALSLSNKVNCYSYKIWSPETIHNWSKLLEELKSTDKMNCSTRAKSAILKRIEQGLL